MTIRTLIGGGGGYKKRLGSRESVAAWNEGTILKPELPGKIMEKCHMVHSDALSR